MLLGRLSAADPWSDTPVGTPWTLPNAGWQTHPTSNRLDVIVSIRTEVPNLVVASAPERMMLRIPESLDLRRFPGYPHVISHHSFIYFVRVQSTPAQMLIRIYFFKSIQRVIDMAVMLGKLPMPTIAAHEAQG